MLARILFIHSYWPLFPPACSGCLYVNYYGGGGVHPRAYLLLRSKARSCSLSCSLSNTHKHACKHIRTFSLSLSVWCEAITGAGILRQMKTNCSVWPFGTILIQWFQHSSNSSSVEAFHLNCRIRTQDHQRIQLK